MEQTMRKFVGWACGGLFCVFQQVCGIAVAADYGPLFVGAPVYLREPAVIASWSDTLSIDFQGQPPWAVGNTTVTVSAVAYCAGGGRGNPGHCLVPAVSQPTLNAVDSSGNRTPAMDATGAPVVFTNAPTRSPYSPYTPIAHWSWIGDLPLGAYVIQVSGIGAGAGTYWLGGFSAAYVPNCGTPTTPPCT
jgi:hypothetical protein